MPDISLKEMAKNAVHFGHPKQRWNPKMAPYLHGLHKGIHIFDLKKTADKLVTALEFLHDVAFRHQTILFVGTKQQCRRPLQMIHEETAMPVISDKWIPGLLTNFKTIKSRIDLFKKLKEDDAQGGFEKYTKKEQLKLRKKIQEMSMVFSGIEDMDNLPDVVFATDVVRDIIPVKEAKRLRIPVVGIVDSNADPDLVDYVIPANDDAIHSIEYILNMAKEAVLLGQKKK